jgi:hypothetical protein
LVSDSKFFCSSSPPFILFSSATLLIGMTGISLHGATASDVSVVWQPTFCRTDRRVQIPAFSCRPKHGMHCHCVY